ncbi:ribonuclease Z [Solirubrobacter sp. CPCC 204708]|uniref:Ribonuclease Z n=1 Tax=Solirubrobacter deserti TaxID=2282478 RepID=A0ABT4RGU5_9ACTN|nr:ribonuclease Z [Solirubrobacter deserti]MBE2315392.1 ribonuclease Z [Solirubrobacter deserti]MDA0137764.1 ribonuclease Z [Solirubrobacter deserti]
MDLSVFFAGTAGSVPTPKRGLPAILLRAGGERILFDCGEGTQHQLLRSVGLPDLDAIFITHLHLDHWLGLPGMIKTFDMRDRDTRLELFGPPGFVATFEKVVRPVIGRTKYPLDVIDLEPHEEIGFDDFVITGFPVKHRVEAFGYAFIEDDRPGKFDAAEAERLGVQAGPDFGRLQRGEIVNGVTPEQVMGEDRRGRRIVYSGDTMPSQTTEVYAADADLLIHEATFCEDERARARETGHSTAAQAAALARDANVKLLALTHLSTRYFPREIREEARGVFENTVIPRDFDAIEVPFPERGDPHLVRAEDVVTPC